MLKSMPVEPVIAVIIPVHNRRELTLKCLHELQKVNQDGFRFDVIVIDDGSTDGTSQAVSTLYPEVILLNGDGNLWWTGAINKGVTYAIENNYDYVLTLNDDIYFDKNFLGILIDASKRYPQSIVSSVSLLHQADKKEDIVVASGFNVSGWLKHLFPVINNQTSSRLIGEIIFCDALSGRSLLIPIEVIKKIGFFDAKRFPHGHADIEFTHRAKLSGISLLINTTSKIYTELNRNHFPVYVINSSRWGFIKNLFNIKFDYGFKMIFSLAFMHKPFYIGIADLCYRLLQIFKWTSIKLIMPKTRLKTLISKKIDMGLYGPLINDHFV